MKFLGEKQLLNIAIEHFDLDTFSVIDGTIKEIEYKISDDCDHCKYEILFLVMNDDRIASVFHCLNISRLIVTFPNRTEISFRIEENGLIERNGQSEKQDTIPFENEENCNAECEKCICHSCVKRCEICIDCSSRPFAVRKSECEKKVGV